MKNIISNSTEMTLNIGADFGKGLKAGSVVGLIGELGAGKTEFVKGVASAFNINKNIVTSPTFTIINEYSGSIDIYHFDFYRINSLEELEELGYEEYFYGNGITLIEWADKFMEVLPDGTDLVYFKYIDDNKRSLEFKRK